MITLLRSNAFAQSDTGNLNVSYKTSKLMKLMINYRRDVVSAVYATATWLAGLVSVTRLYCIKMAKPILKLFRPSGSPRHSSFF